MATRDPARQRILRHRHKRERQALIFGGLIAGLAVAAFIASAIFTGTITPPFANVRLVGMLRPSANTVNLSAFPSRLVSSQITMRSLPRSPAGRSRLG